MLIFCLISFYLICAALTYGLSMAFWAAEFPNCAQYSEDAEISTFMAALGPVGLLAVWFLTKWGHYGFACTPTQFEAKNEHGLKLYGEGKLFW